MEKDHIIANLSNFLTQIGIEVIEEKINVETFLPGLLIRNGSIVFDRNSLLYPGDLLHEAGHIAVTDSPGRKLLNGNITTIQSDNESLESAVLLWTFAACNTLAIDPEIVFHKDGYKGQSEWLLTNFRSASYIGLPLLVWMGMTTNDKLSGFPNMLRWLR